MYYLKRILFMIPLLVVISFLAFALMKAVPGGPFDRDRQPASPEIKRNLRAKYHLDDPLWKQYARYLGGLVRGDFGPSMKYRDHTVNDIIKQGLPVSMTLGLLAFCFAQAVGVPVGFYTAVRRGHWQEWLGSFLAIVLVCVPALVVAPLLVMVFGIKLGILPVALWDSPLHAILPTAALGLFFSGRVARLMREGMLTTLKEPFVMSARAKGLSHSAVLLKHAFRLGVLPVVSYSGPMLADLLTGSFVVENVFRIPGIGVFVVNSFLNRDHTMLVGLVVVYAALLLVLNLVVDFLYTILDPRVRYE
jgi:oligopeptide transport system permease protein